jgi:phosphate transport system substrate-binding protein
MTMMFLSAIAAAAVLSLCLGCFGGKGKSLSLVGSTSVAPFAEMLAQNYQKKFPDRSVEVQGGGSSVGLSSTANGLADIGMCSRALSPEEAKQLNEIVIARDGLAVVVHPTNPVRDLSADQIRKLFTGQISNWKEVGGPDLPVRIITREEGSGTRESFANLVMKGEKISIKALVQESNGTVKKLVQTDPQAVGYMSLGLVLLGKEVKPVNIDGVTASEANVVAGAYKFSRPFLFVTKGRPSGDAQQFIEYVLSPEGQKVLADEGLIPPK